MAFAIRNLSVCAYANGFTLWHYKTTDTLYDTAGADYFSDAADMMAVGDIIVICVGNAATQRVVSYADSNNVNTAPMTVLPS